MFGDWCLYIMSIYIYIYIYLFIYLLTVLFVYSGSPIKSLS